MADIVPLTRSPDGQITTAGANTIGIANGGTGATNAADARTNLGVAPDTALQPGDGLAALDSAAASKLTGIEDGAQVNVQSDWNAVSGDAFISNKPTLGALAAKSSVDIADINATGTPSSSNYLRGDGAWAADTVAVWGSVTGTLSDQTDLQNALDAKASASALSAHTSDTNNPHNVTKAKIDLGNVDNTADASKEVLSATKLKTARTIGGVSFDGTADINLPGVNTAGNQNTTGSAAKWTTARTLTIGDTGKSVDGSAAVSWTLAEIGAGDVNGPASSTSGNVALFDGTTGKLIKDGGTLGSAAFTATSDYATAAQGATADNALPKAGGTMTGNITFAGGQTWPTFNQNTTGTASNVTGTVAISNGGTGATDAATARSNLGAGDVTGPASSTNNNVALFDGATGKLLKDGGTLGTAAFTDSSAYATAAQGATADNALPKSGGTMTGNITFDGGQTWPTFNQNTTGTAANVTGIVAVANGGTGATDAATARSNLGAGDVVGPASSIANNLAIFNGLTGKALKDKSDTVQLDTDSGKADSATTGTDLVTNGDFASDTIWTKGAGWSITGGQAVFDATVATPGALQQSITVTANKLYLITWTATNSSSRNAGMSVSIGGVGLGGAMLPGTAANTYSVALAVTIGGSATFSITPIVYNKSGTVTIDNVSVREITQTVPDLILSSPSGDIAVTAKNKSLFIGGGGLSNTSGVSNFASGDKALFNNTSGSNNVALGDGALFNNTIGSNNYASGSRSLFNNISGSNNFASGYQSLYNNTTGNNNFASGINTLLNNTAGYDNVAIGADVLNKNTIGFGNIGIGFNALYENTNGGNNCAFGTRALLNNTTGYSNFAMGYEALRNNSTGFHNSSVGSGSTVNLSSGSYNTSIGSAAGVYYGSGFSNLTTLNNSTLIGRNTRPSANSAVNQTVIGYSAIGVGDNTVSLGNSAVTLTSTYGQLSSSGTYSATSASAANVFIDTDGKMYRSTSSAQYKTDIEPIDTAIADKLILQANPVWYRSTSARDAGKSYYGLIAEEVAELDPRMVQWGYPTKRITVLEAREETADVYDDEGNLVESGQPAIEAQYADVPDYEAKPIPEGVNYTAMIAPLIDLVKRQQAAIESLVDRVAALEKGSGGKVLQ